MRSTRGCPTGRTPRRPTGTAPAGRPPAICCAAGAASSTLAAASGGPASAAHERARHAEHIARGEQTQHDEAAPVNPRQNAGQVHGADLRPAQPVQDNEARQNGHRQLHGEPGVPPAQEAAQPGTRSRSNPGRGNRASGDPTIRKGNRAPLPFSLSLSPCAPCLASLPAVQELDPDPEQGQEKQHRPRNPHDGAGRRLVGERGLPGQPGDLR